MNFGFLESGIPEREWKSRYRRLVNATWDRTLYAVTKPIVEKLFARLGATKKSQKYVAFPIDVAATIENGELTPKEIKFVTWMREAGYEFAKREDGTPAPDFQTYANNFLAGKAWNKSGKEVSTYDVANQYLDRAKRYIRDTEREDADKAHAERMWAVRSFLDMIFEDDVWGFEIDDLYDALVKGEKNKTYAGHAKAKEAVLSVLEDEIRGMRKSSSKTRYWGILSYDPRVIASMSTRVNWKSCHELPGGMYCELVGSTIAAGAFIAFVMRSKGELPADVAEKIQKGAIPLRDLFDENDSILKATGRLLFKPYVAAATRKLARLLGSKNAISDEDVAEAAPGTDPNDPRTLYDFSRVEWVPDKDYGTFPLSVRQAIIDRVNAAQPDDDSTFIGIMPFARQKGERSIKRAMYIDKVDPTLVRVSSELSKAADEFFASPAEYALTNGDRFSRLFVEYAKAGIGVNMLNSFSKTAKYLDGHLSPNSREIAGVIANAIGAAGADGVLAFAESELTEEPGVVERVFDDDAIRGRMFDAVDEIRAAKKEFPMSLFRAVEKSGVGEPLASSKAGTGIMEFAAAFAKIEPMVVGSVWNSLSQARCGRNGIDFGARMFAAMTGDERLAVLALHFCSVSNDDAAPTARRLLRDFPEDELVDSLAFGLRECHLHTDKRRGWLGFSHKFTGDVEYDGKDVSRTIAAIKLTADTMLPRERLIDEFRSVGAETAHASVVFAQTRNGELLRNNWVAGALDAAFAGENVLGAVVEVAKKRGAFTPTLAMTPWGLWDALASADSAALDGFFENFIYDGNVATWRRIGDLCTTLEKSLLGRSDNESDPVALIENLFEKTPTRRLDDYDVLMELLAFARALSPAAFESACEAIDENTTLQSTLAIAAERWFFASSFDHAKDHWTVIACALSRDIPEIWMRAGAGKTAVGAGRLAEVCKKLQNVDGVEEVEAYAAAVQNAPPEVFPLRYENGVVVDSDGEAFWPKVSK